MTEIAYIIDQLETEKLGQLIIRLVESNGSTPIIDSKSKKTFTPQTLRQLATTKDKEAIKLLIDEESLYQKKLTGNIPKTETLSLNSIHIASINSIDALKILSATGKLYFNGKQLVTDFYTKIEFYYQIEPLSQQQIKVTGRVKWRDQDFDIRECELIGQGKPNWFIRGLSLKVIHTDVSWKRLQQVRGELILSGIEKTSFLDDLDPQDPDSPKSIILGGSQSDIEKLSEPLPLLILKDRTGAFADLLMDYGKGNTTPIHQISKEIKNSSGETIAIRHFAAEKNWEKDLLETDFIKKEVSTSHYYCPIDKVSKSLNFLLELGWNIIDSKSQRVVRQDSLDLTMDYSKEILTVKGSVRYADFEANVADVIGAFNRRERFVQLGNGTVGLLPNSNEQNKLRELAEEGEIVGNELKVKKSHIGSLSTFFTNARISPSLMNLKERLQNFKCIEEAEPGKAFTGKLRPYQQQGLNWLSFLLEYGFHGILADDMGLGKTVQVLALLSRLPQEGPHLIVVPTSLIFNWKNEIETFLPGTSFTIHYGQKRNKSIQELSKANIIITSYSTLRQDLQILQSFPYFSVILDEAQVIKNANTQTAQAVFSLQAQFRLSITGTPLENHLGELWSHFRFLIPDLFGEENEFLGELQAAESDSRYLQRIKKKISPFILRRKKEEVAKDLPERIDQAVWVEMTEDQRRIYDGFLASVKGNLLKKVDLDGIGKHRIEIFEAILRLRQICCHPLLISNMNEEATTVSSAKFDAVMQDLETIIEEGRKVLIYSQFTTMLHVFTKAANEKGWKFAYLDGSTINREKVVSSFQEDPSINLFFISLKAGGVGLNLTAADYVILFDPWWNEAVEEQAINRVHRIGRKDTVIAKRFLTIESIEERIMKLKESKRGIIDEVLDEEVGNLRMSSEDLRYLLS
ncbi:MAG: DEAD/DEAH box helicase [Parachlamydiaceae bacterium]|nr:DEAD/DEAH box helicase [Parachlamydiaceae bacterium]